MRRLKESALHAFIRLRHLLRITQADAMCLRECQQHEGLAIGHDGAILDLAIAQGPGIQAGQRSLRMTEAFQMRQGMARLFQIA